MPGPLTPTGALRAQYSVLIVLITAVLISGGGILYTNHTQQRSDQRWCAWLAVQAAEDPPPTTPRGIAAQTEARRLQRSFGCPK